MTFYKVRSIYFAAFLMTAYKRKMVGSEMDNGRIQFHFYSEGNETALMEEFSGRGLSKKMVAIDEFMLNVNKLKDVISALSRTDQRYPNDN